MYILAAPAAPQDSLLEQVRVVLESRCMSCHGQLQMSALDLRQRETMLKGGNRGPAIVPGKPEESLLFLAASHDERTEIKMPPGGDPLPIQDLALLRSWIEAGAPWGKGATLETEQAGSSWWSFQKPKRPPLPTVREKDWVKNPVDAFILAKLEKRGLPHAPRAERRVLIRRAYFDLIGLPPEPEEVRRFVEDPSPNAYPNLIDQLLDSPRYGERWGRHWLDLVRYGESQGLETDYSYPHAWRYRDYVIKSFNEDKPYNRFLQEQVAGDELWPNSLTLERGTFALQPDKLRDLEARVGTGFYAVGPETGEFIFEKRKLIHESLSDWVDTTAAVFLGVTFACARCHDHKFDPFTQEDYYRMQAIFAGSQKVDIPVVSELGAYFKDESTPRAIHLDEQRKAYRMFEAKVRERVIGEKKKEFPQDVVRAYEIVAADERPGFQAANPSITPDLRERAEALRQAVADLNLKDRLEEQMIQEEKEERLQLLERLAKAVLEIPEIDIHHNVRFDAFFDVPKARVLGHLEPALVREVHLLERGELDRPGEKMEPGIPRVLDDGSVEFDRRPEWADYVPHSRKGLALWLTRKDHPLTARVMANRLWLWHFGEGIVRTPNDFGKMGSGPSHSGLLDWLATQLVQGGWSLKAMHRLIMLSNTYQMASRYFDERAALDDPGNRCFWRMNGRRVEGEILWDALHMVAGNLNLEMGGRPALPPLNEEELVGIQEKKKWELVVPADPSQHHRRGIYILARRNFTFPLFAKFDSPQHMVSCPRRDETTVAPQALWLLNNRTIQEQARVFAARLVREQGNHPSAWVSRAWWLALGRGPSEKELQEALLLLKSMASKNLAPAEPLGDFPPDLRGIDRATALALVQLCLGILNLNEFVYID